MILQAQLYRLEDKIISTTLLYILEGPNSLDPLTNFNEEYIHLLNLKLETQVVIYEVSSVLLICDEN